MLRLATSGLKCAAGADAFLHQHGRRAARGDVDDAIRGLLDHLEEGLERFRPLVRLAGDRIARMQVHDGRAGFRRADRRFGNLLRRHRQIGRHRRAYGSRR
jgi:cob(I)alamin adenosyltransferase